MTTRQLPPTMKMVHHDMTPKEIIKFAIQRYNSEKFEMLYSGGRDSTATLHTTQQVIKELGKKIDLKLHYWDTLINAEENKEFVQSVAAKEGLELVTVKPKPHFQYEPFVERFGFPGPKAHQMTLGFLKWFGFREAARAVKDENVLYISGRRKQESTNRMNMASLQPVEHPETNIRTVAPHYYLGNTERDYYLKKYDLKVSPVYQTMHIDGNCGCGSHAGPDELKMMYIFHQPLFEKIQRIDDRLGGEQTVRIIEPLEECPNCKALLPKRKKDVTRFINGVHHYLFKCPKCGETSTIPDEKMPHHMGPRDNGHWGKGVSCKELIAGLPNENDYCRGCKSMLMMKGANALLDNFMKQN